LQQPVNGKLPLAVLAIDGSENLKICRLDFWVFFDCTFLDNFKTRSKGFPLACSLVPFCTSRKEQPAAA
jgi:hypothetical protein